MLAEMLNPGRMRQNEIELERPGALWWWNLKMARGDQLNGDELYYPDQETLIRSSGELRV